MINALLLILAFASFVYAAFRANVRWVAVGLALMVASAALHALASLV